MPSSITSARAAASASPSDGARSARPPRGSLKWGRPGTPTQLKRRQAGAATAATRGGPHGAQRPEVKALEARLAIADGARELDMVLNVGALRSGDDAAVRADIAAVVAEARPHGVLVKVILETCLLAPEQIVAACRLAEEAGAGFVKTSTGFGGGGATPETVRTMLDAVGGRLGVKASGGIRSWEDAERYLDMGCARLGVGDAATILDGSPAGP
jgi:deoxyribose-phosphate aldolase